ncbi:MAG: 2-oxoacid:acceptor oxidoreductase family protein [Patescibacteria group bacterium]
MYEIRVHGRAGQGAKTVAQFLAEAVLRSGDFVQAFPSYGPEREGAVMDAFIRIDKKPIQIHSQIYKSDILAVIDPTLLTQDIVASVKSNGVVIINSSKDNSALKNIFFPGKIYVLDASAISKKYLKKDMPNLVILGVISRIINIPASIIEDIIREKFMLKFGSEITEANLKAFREGIKAVEI